MRHFKGTAKGGSKRDGAEGHLSSAEGSVRVDMNHFDGKDHWTVEIRDRSGGILAHFSGDFQKKETPKNPSP